MASELKQETECNAGTKKNSREVALSNNNTGSDVVMALQKNGKQNASSILLPFDHSKTIHIEDASTSSQSSPTVAEKEQRNRKKRSFHKFCGNLNESGKSTKRQKLNTPSKSHQYTLQRLFKHESDQRDFADIFQSVEKSAIIRTLQVSHGISEQIAEYATGSIEICGGRRCLKEILVMSEFLAPIDWQWDQENEFIVDDKDGKYYCKDCSRDLIVLGCDCGRYYLHEKDRHDNYERLWDAGFFVCMECGDIGDDLWCPTCSDEMEECKQCRRKIGCCEEPEYECVDCGDAYCRECMEINDCGAECKSCTQCGNCRYKHCNAG